MRRLEFALNTCHHIVIRGARGMTILPEISDWWHSLSGLHYHNDKSRPEQWQRDLVLHDCQLFERPSHWPVREPLVSIMAFCLHSNHIHLLVKEIREGGISEFMSRLPKNLTHRFNSRYGGSGSIFQGPYKSRRITTDADLHNVALYIMAKNVMERYPKGGIKQARDDFSKAWSWACQDSFSSFADYAINRHSLIIEKEELAEHFPTLSLFQKEVRLYIKDLITREESLGDLTLED